MAKLAKDEQDKLFVGGKLTMMQNSAKNYGLDLDLVKSLYIEAVQEELAVTENPEQLPTDLFIKSLKSGAWRKIWFSFVNKCQAEVKKEGHGRKGSMTRLENKVKQIIANDKLKAKLKLHKLVTKFAEARGEDRQRIRVEMDNYQKFFEYVDQEKALNHFMNRMKLDPKITSFIFKPKKS